jgi:hypothetical protein
MGRLTEVVFNESCCDGGACSSDMSCQPCGCDKGCKGGPYVCERHLAEAEAAIRMMQAAPEVTRAAIAAPTSAAPSVGDATWRKQRPLWSGVLNYFPDALLEVAHVSWVGNEQHNPGTELHWDRSKSKDEKDACARHLMEAGKFDSDGTRHSAKVAWRALANLQKEIEAEK